MKGWKGDFKGTKEHQKLLEVMDIPTVLFVVTNLEICPYANIIKF